MPGVNGQALRAWRRSLGWDVPEMARRLRATAGGEALPAHDALVRTIRRWERGTYNPSERYELLYARALSIAPGELAVPPGAGSADGTASTVAPRHSTLTEAISSTTSADLSGQAAVPRPGAEAVSRTLGRWDEASMPAEARVLSAGQAGPREIGFLEQSVSMFRMWDHEHGGGLGRKAAAGQLAEVAAFLSVPHPASLRKRLLGVASQLALTVASMSADGGDTPMARRYLWLALEAAREAQDASLGARAVNAIARRQLDDGNAHDALGLLGQARKALRGLPPDMTALLCTTQAWACARLGDHGEMAACLDQAQTLTGKTGSLFGPAELAGIAGACYEALAARASLKERAGHAARAEDRIAAALRMRDGFYARSRALDLAGLANVRLLQHEPEEAMRTAAAALDAAASLRSGRAARSVHGLAVRALDQFPDVPAVEDFADMVRSRLPVALPQTGALGDGMQWTVHGRRVIYDSPWVSLDLIDVEQPDGKRYEQHVVRMARPVAGTVMTKDDRVLLMWRHRHVTGTWGWEIPSGRIEEGETPEQAAAREAEEETGWRPGPLRLLVASQPSNGSVDTVHYLFHAEGAEHVGPPSDSSEADRIEWVPLREIRGLIAKGEIVSGPTLIAVLLAGA